MQTASLCTGIVACKCKNALTDHVHVESPQRNVMQNKGTRSKTKMSKYIHTYIHYFGNEYMCLTGSNLGVFIGWIVNKEMSWRVIVLGA